MPDSDEPTAPSPSKLSFFAELKRRKVVRVAITYAIVAWIIIQVAAATFPGFEIPMWAFRFVVLMLILGFPVALILAWAFELTPDGIKLTKNVSEEQKAVTSQGKRNWLSLGFAAALPAVIFGSLAVYFYFSRGNDEVVAKTDSSIAVLAFKNLSEDADNEYFSDGISEELLNVLAKIPGLKVSARTSSFYFKDNETPIPEIAKQLGVAYVLEGSVRKAGDTVRITAQLIKADSGFHLWSDTFTRELKDIFAVQGEIAGLIAKRLQLELGVSTVSKKIVNPEAYRLTLLGNHFWLQRTEAALLRAEEAYRKAVDLDPEFAEAHAGLAKVWMINGWYAFNVSAHSREENFERAKAKAEMAISLDPTLAEPHATLGAIFFNQLKIEEAEREFQKALRLNPNYSFAHTWYSFALMARGDLEGTLREIDKAVELDPLAFITVFTAARFYSFAADYETALSLNNRATALGSEDFVPFYGMRAYILMRMGRTEEAVAPARKTANLVNVGNNLAWLDALAVQILRDAGFNEEAQAYGNALRTIEHKGPYVQGSISMAMGQNNRALEELVVDADSIDTVFYSSLWDEVREAPRFLETIEDQGFAEEYKRARESRARLIEKSKDGGVK